MEFIPITRNGKLHFDIPRMSMSQYTAMSDAVARPHVRSVYDGVNILFIIGMNGLSRRPLRMKEKATNASIFMKILSDFRMAYNFAAILP